MNLSKRFSLLFVSWVSIVLFLLQRLCELFLPFCDNSCVVDYCIFDSRASVFSCMFFKDHQGLEFLVTHIIMCDRA